MEHGTFINKERTMAGQAPSLDTGEPTIRQIHFSGQEKLSLTVDNSVG